MLVVWGAADPWEPVAKAEELFSGWAAEFMALPGEPVAKAAAAAAAAAAEIVSQVCFTAALSTTPCNRTFPSTTNPAAPLNTINAGINSTINTTINTTIPAGTNHLHVAITNRLQLNASPICCICRHQPGFCTLLNA
jgi:hypothetical protein